MGTTTANSRFAIGGVSFSADSIVAKGSAVLRMNICAEKPAHRKSAKRSADIRSALRALLMSVRAMARWIQRLILRIIQHGEAGLC